MNFATSLMTLRAIRSWNLEDLIVDEPSSPRKWAWIVLFTSSSTLICCALPILFVSIGLGAVSASLFASMPFLVTLVQYKSWVFAASGIVLAITAWLLYRPGRVCPADSELADLCNKAHHWNLRFFWAASLMWLVGFAAAYLALPVYLWFGAA